MSIDSLRLALGLPPHDLFTDGIFNNYVHHETVGADVEDTDHGAVQPAPPPAMPALPAPPPASPDSQALVRNSVTDSPPPEQV